MRHKILLLGPSSGRRCECAEQIVRNPSRRHKVAWFPSARPGANFSYCWATALGNAQQGNITHAAMLHDDVGVIDGETDDVRCLDVLAEELDRTGANFISTMIACKDMTGLLSCGVGDPGDFYQPWRRWTQSDQPKLPQTFSAADVGYGDKFLNHNFGLCMWDLRAPVWHQRDAKGFYKLTFNYVTGIWGDGKGKTHTYVLGEDTHYSRLMWQLGATSVITQRLVTRHMLEYLSFDSHGRSPFGVGAFANGDEELAYKWRATDPLVGSVVKISV